MSSARPRTVLFLNLHSRRVASLAQKIIDDFTKNTPQLAVVEVIVVRNLKRLDYHLEVLRTTKRLECVVVAGGDGTIVAILNALKRKKVTYGFLPLGTSNTYARSLGIPLNYNGARKVIMSGNRVAASTGSVNGHVFANIAGIGVPAEVSAVTTKKIKKLLGPLAYIWNGVRAVRGHQAFHCYVVNDDVKESFYTHYLIFANGKYHGNISLGKDVSAYNDQLVLFAFGVSPKRRHGLSAMIKLIFRRAKRDPHTRIIPFKRLYVTTTPKKAIEADGELIGHTPASVEINYQSIQVYAPRTAILKK